MTLTRFRWWHLEQVMPAEHELFAPHDWSLATYWSELAAPGRVYTVAVDGERVLGWSGAAVTGADADVQTIAVTPAAQGTGLGKQLLGRLVNDVAAAGATRVLLEVRANNEPAIGLYERCGFAVIARRKRYYQPGDIDALIMERGDL